MNDFDNDVEIIYFVCFIHWCLNLMTKQKRYDWFEFVYPLMFLN